jgi:RHS repeat-associated protein
VTLEPISSGQHQYCHSDGSGNIVALLNVNQLTTAYYVYEPFGRILLATGSMQSDNLYCFSSRESHSLSAIIHYLYRYYEPSIQKWLQRDPIAEPGFLVLQRINPHIEISDALRHWVKPSYVFSANSPQSNVDPFGLFDVRGPNAKWVLQARCKQPIYRINDDGPRADRWKWKLSPGAGSSFKADGIGYFDKKGNAKGYKAPNLAHCVVACDDDGYVIGFACSCPVRQDGPWTPGGGEPDNLPPLPGQK